MKRKKHWSVVVDKFAKRLASWKSKMLSFGGRLTLVKSVLGSLPLYFFLMFRAPSCVIHTLERIRKDFFWGGSEGGKLAWVKWSTVVSSFDRGGLGIGCLKAANLALLGKWWWRFKTESNAPWACLIRSLYGRDGGLGQNVIIPSRLKGGVWENIVSLGRVLDSSGVQFSSSFGNKLGDGSSTLFWLDIWVDSRRLCDRFPRLFRLDKDPNVIVADRGRLVDGNWVWVWDWTRNPRGRVVNELSVLYNLIQNTCPVSDRRDKWWWKMDDNGEFSVKKLRDIIELKLLPSGETLVKTGWNYLAPRKVNVVVWRVLKDSLPVRINLVNRGIDLDSVLCRCCNEEPETMVHYLLECRIATKVWSLIGQWWKIEGNFGNSACEILNYYGGSLASSWLKSVWQATLWSAIYMIWDHHNQVFFRSKTSSADLLFADIQTRSFDWISRRIRKGRILHDLWLSSPFLLTPP